MIEITFCLSPARPHPCRNKLGASIESSTAHSCGDHLVKVLGAGGRQIYKQTTTPRLQLRALLLFTSHLSTSSAAVLILLRVTNPLVTRRESSVAPRPENQLSPKFRSRGDNRSRHSKQTTFSIKYLYIRQTLALGQTRHSDHQRPRPSACLFCTP